MTEAIRAEKLVKAFGHITALDGVSKPIYMLSRRNNKGHPETTIVQEGDPVQPGDVVRVMSRLPEAPSATSATATARNTVTPLAVSPCRASLLLTCSRTWTAPAACACALRRHQPR